MTRILSGEELSRRWYKCIPFVERSLAHGTGDIKPYDLFIECLAATSQCWVEEYEGHIVGVAITRIVRHKQYDELVIVCTTCKDWAVKGPEILDKIEEFAKGYGCKYVSVYGRKGWARVLKQFGYHQPYTLLSKEI